MGNKLLSIVVPTKNRYYYLKYLIRLINELNTDDIELVIQDNSDNNQEFLEYLNKEKFDFIRYDYVRGQIPMADNSDRGILNSTGEYVCFIGDDDGVTKYIIDAVKWMKRNGVEALKTASPNYCWPDAPVGRKAAILYQHFTEKVEFLSPMQELIKVLRGGICTRGNMPLAYHSIVKRETLDIVYNVCGTYFPGNSPDISNAVALSLVVKKFALVNVPVAYSGSSAYKGGGVYARGNAAPAIDQIPWFRPNPVERWDKELPQVAAGSIIWADSALESLNRMGRNDIRKYFDKYKCYANLIVSMPNLSQYVYAICGNSLKLKVACLDALLKKYYNGIVFHFGKTLRMANAPHYVDGVNNIIEASRALEELSNDAVFSH